MSSSAIEQEAISSFGAPDSRRVLRWWPAAAIVLVMFGVKFVPALFEAPDLPILMLGFMGPAGIGLMLVPWWLFASRASWTEKICGLVGLVAIVALGLLFDHPSLQGMPAILFQFPVGLAAFGLSLTVLAGLPSIRVGMALLITALSIGYWDLLRMEGTTGRFDAELAWRWTPSAEEEYLRSLQSPSVGEAAVADSADTVAEVIVSAQSPWPEFRGRERDGVVRGITLADDWTTQPPQLKWKTLIGPGWSSFCVAADRLFSQEQRGDEEAVVCLSAETGETIWVATYPGRFWEAIGGAGPRATPTLGNNQLFALGADGQLTAFRPATGEVLWKRSLREDAGREPPQWGWSASPLVVGSAVVVHAGGAGDKGVLAYDVDTGEPLWSSPSGDHSYSSPHRATFDGVSGLLMMTNTSLQFLNADDGSSIWEHAWKIDSYRAVQPLVSGNCVLMANSLGAGTRKLTVEQSEGSWNISEDWTSLSMKPEYNDFVLFDGHVYGFDGNILACIDLASGERKWKRGRYGNGQLVLLPDAAQLLVISEQGELALVAADPQAFREMGKVQAIEGKTWNHPVLVGNRVYVRNGQEAACYELALKDATSVQVARLKP